MIQIAVLGNKGGVGKTAIATHLAWALAERYRVTLVDADYAQHSGLRWLTRITKPAELDRAFRVENKPALSCLPLSTNKVEDYKKLIPIGTDFAVIDGRPEPKVTIAVMRQLEKGDVIILPIDAGSKDSLRQAYELHKVISRTPTSARVYTLFNKIPWSRLPPRARAKLEEYGLHVLGGIPWTEYFQWSERQGVPLWDIRGGKRTKAAKFIGLLAEYISKGVS